MMIDDMNARHQNIETRLEAFAQRTVIYFDSFLLRREIYIEYSKFSQMREQIKEAARGYFEGIPSPHELGGGEVENYAADVVEVLENVLDKMNVKIPDDERMGDDDEACLFGKVYYDITAAVIDFFYELEA